MDEFLVKILYVRGNLPDDVAKMIQWVAKNIKVYGEKKFSLYSTGDDYVAAAFGPRKLSDFEMGWLVSTKAHESFTDLTSRTRRMTEKQIFVAVKKGYSKVANINTTDEDIKALCRR